MTLRVHVWDRCLMLQADSLSLAPRARSHKRLSATILVAGAEPFSIQLDGQAPRRCQGLVLAPNVSRNLFEAQGSELTLLDAGITTPTYHALEPCLRGQQARELEAVELDLLQPLLGRARAAELDCAGAAALFDEVTRLLGGRPARQVEYDSRVREVMRIAEQRPLDELSLPMLAEAAGLSVSRLRALFQASLGCGPAQYLRWAAAWEAIRLWQPGMRFTDVAHQVGFHDLAHIDHALVELFGVSPSAVTTAQGVRFHKCWS